jgi:hypothetical protein
VIQAPDLAGDEPISLLLRQFTLPEAAALSRVPQKSVRNWISRDVLRIGERHSFLARWMFSVLDVIRLRVMHDLCINLTFNPRDAARIADLVANLAMDETKRDASGRLIDGADGVRPNKNVVVAFNGAGEAEVCVADIKTPGSYYPPLSTGGDDPLRRAHVVVPVSTLLNDVILRTAEVARQHVRAEAPVHD